MSGSYGIVGWEYPNIKEVKIADAEEESSRFTFPDWLKDRVCAKRGVSRDGCVFCAFSAQSDSKNTAIRQTTLEQEELIRMAGMCLIPGCSSIGSIDLSTLKVMQMFL